MRIVAETSLKELLSTCPEVCDVLLSMGLECPSCMGAEFETVSEACRAHALDAEVVIMRLQAAVDIACDSPEKE